MNAYQIQETLRRGTMVAAPIQASRPDVLAWVGIYPLDLSLMETARFFRNRRRAVLPNAGE
jgi:hypothetical protein